MPSLPLRIRRFYNCIKRFGVRAARNGSTGQVVVGPQEVKTPKKKRFKPCTSSEPHKCKEVWVDRLQLPYYQEFRKIKTPSVKVREEPIIDTKLKVAPNPKPIGIGLVRKEITNEQLEKLTNEYNKQKECNIIAMKTQILSGREPTDKIPEIKVQEKLNEEKDSDNSNETPKGSSEGVLRAV